MLDRSDKRAYIEVFRRASAYSDSKSRLDPTNLDLMGGKHAKGKP
jgi:hypothetical protein